jgi:hypothetical protein
VTQSGFRRGFLRRAGPAQRESVGRTGFTGASGTETRRTPGSAAGCNKPATERSGGNHRGGAKPRGWNRTSRVGTRGAEGVAGRHSRSGRFIRTSMEGHQAHREHACFAVWTNRERRPLVGQGIRYGSEEERKREARTADPSGIVGRAASGTPRGPTGNGEGRGGGGESNQPLRWSTGPSPSTERRKAATNLTPREPRGSCHPGTGGESNAEKLSGRRI